MKHRELLCMFGLLGLMTGCSNAAEGVGVITAQLDDEHYHGITLGETRNHQASATWSRFGPVTILNLQAHDPEAESMMLNVFNLEISLTDRGGSPQVDSATFSYWPEGMNNTFYSSEESEVTVTFESFTLDDNAHVVGTFSGQMCAKSSFFSEPDTSDCKNVTGTFDTVLVNET